MSKQIGSDFISVSIDLGADTTKAACSYKTPGGNYDHELLLEEGEGISSMAYYDNESGKWIFGKKEILAYAEKSFSYLVKVKDLLDLFSTRAKDKLYESNYFKVFHYPPKEDESYADAVKKGDCFQAKNTPREVAKMFVKYCVDRIKAETAKKFGAVKIRFVVVYPANAPKSYIKELVGFVKDAAASDDIYIISAPRAVGVSAKEYGVVTKEKNALLFNIGEDEISVVKMRFDQSNISVYGADGHNAPERIGGKNFDIALSAHLYDRSEQIKPIGETDGGQTVERGVFFDQFRMQEGIKAGKRVFSDGLACLRLGGFSFSIYREMITTVKVTQKDFAECCTPVFEKMWKYVERELKREDNDDVETVIFSGGAADTYGLDKYVTEKLKKKFPSVDFRDFSPENKHQGYDDVLCAAKDTVPIGAALFGIGKYSFKLLTSLSYGTYKSDAHHSAGSGFKYVEFVPKGAVIDLKGKPDFKVEKMAKKPYKGGPKIFNNKCLIFNEYYSCDTDVFRKKFRKAFGSEESDDIVFRTYKPEGGFKKDKTGKKVTFDAIGYHGSSTVSMSMERIGCYLLVYKFPKDFSGDRELMAKNPYMHEGFEIDFEGRVTPIVKNVSHKTYDNLGKLNQFQLIFQQIELVLEPNGMDVII